jgi:hypothetical protein
MQRTIIAQLRRELEGAGSEIETEAMRSQAASTGCHSGQRRASGSWLAVRKISTSDQPNVEESGGVESLWQSPQAFRRMIGAAELANRICHFSLRRRIMER